MTTEIRFYHLTNRSVEEALPALLSKACQNGHKITLRGNNAARMEKLSDYLWTYNPNSFLPHGTAKDGEAGHQPIWLTDQDENPNQADILILIDGQTTEKQNDYTMICEMFDGRMEESVKSARARWKSYKENEELELTYWQQNESGGWDKKA